MIKTYRLRNLLMAEQITGPELETLLQKKDYLGALYDLRNDRVWMADILQHPGAVTILAWSQTAMELVGDQAMPVVNRTSTAIAALVERLAGLPHGAYIDMAAVAASETALAAVLASETALAAVLASETAMAAVAASETALAAVLASETAMAAVWGSTPAIRVLNSSETAKNFFLNKSTTVRTYTDQPNLPKGKILVTKVRFETGGDNVELITRAGGSINDTPIKNNVGTDQIVIQAIIDCNIKMLGSNNPWTNISYIQVAP